MFSGGSADSIRPEDDFPHFEAGYMHAVFSQERPTEILLQTGMGPYMSKNSNVRRWTAITLADMASMT